METKINYENYPIWIVFLSNLVSFAIYGLGFLIFLRIGWYYSGLYLLFILILEYRLIKNHCTNCFYWGKTCGFGKGRISSWFFKKGDISKFCIKEMTWKDMVPDVLVFLMPFLLGLFLLIIKFDIMLLSSLIMLLLLTTIGNSFIRRALTCKYCKQREFGCPADKLFNKGDKEKL